MCGRGGGGDFCQEDELIKGLNTWEYTKKRLRQLKEFRLELATYT